MVCVAANWLSQECKVASKAGVMVNCNINQVNDQSKPSSYLHFIFIVRVMFLTH